jgi:hypothetical protein
MDEGAIEQMICPPRRFLRTMNSTTGQVKVLVSRAATALDDRKPVAERPTGCTSAPHLRTPQVQVCEGR